MNNKSTSLNLPFQQHHATMSPNAPKILRSRDIVSQVPKRNLAINQSRAMYITSFVVPWMLATHWQAI